MGKNVKLGVGSLLVYAAVDAVFVERSDKEISTLTGIGVGVRVGFPDVSGRVLRVPILVFAGGGRTGNVLRFRRSHRRREFLNHIFRAFQQARNGNRHGIRNVGCAKSLLNRFFRSLEE